MAKGRPPKPTAINNLKGDPGKRRRNTTEPKPPEGHPNCPQHVKDDAIAYAEWIDVCNHLASMGLLAKTDKTLLEVYATTYSKWRRAQANVSQYGDVLLLGPAKYPTMSPWANFERRYQDDMRRMLIEMGFTPAARARMRMTVEKPGTSKWAGILKLG